MPAAVEIRESFSVQSPSFPYGTTLVAERVETLLALDEPAMAGQDDFAALAAQYRRVPEIENRSGGLPGDRYPF